MKTFKVPIFTEEYKIEVAIGTTEELAKLVSKTCLGWDYEDAYARCRSSRGLAFNRLPDMHPLIALDGELPWDQALATLPHEACHAVAYIMDFLGIKDENGGEFLGHGISAVMRHCFKNVPSLKERLK